jgi:hypothetical protein
MARKSQKSVPAKTTAAKTAAKSTWVTQSSVVPEAGMAVSKFTTQSQRRLLRGIVAGEITTQVEAPAPTVRSIARLAELKLVTVAKNGAVKPTAAGKTFVEASPAPRVREAAKPAAKPAAKKTAGKPAAKRTVTRKVGKRSPKSAPTNSAAAGTPSERREARQAAAAKSAA